METAKQKTLKGSFSLFGKGLHTGLSLTVVFNPAPENSGYKIQRTDLDGAPIIDAVAEKVIDTQRGTVLGEGNVRVSTVEHGLAALYGNGPDITLVLEGDGAAVRRNLDVTHPQRRQRHGRSRSGDTDAYCKQS